MKKSTVILLIVNVFGMLCLLNYVSSARDLALAEQRSYYDFGDSAGFLIWVVPLLLACLLANIVWVGKSAFSAFRTNSYRPAVACAVVVSLWVLVMLVAREWATLPSNLALQPMPYGAAELVR